VKIAGASDFIAQQPCGARHVVCDHGVENGRSRHLTVSPHISDKRLFSIAREASLSIKALDQHEGFVFFEEFEILGDPALGLA
jgi:hypothetical protein